MIPLVYKPVSPWTPDRDSAILRMWADGESSREIARALGDVVSRAAVIGRLRRLGAPKRPSPVATIKRAPHIRKPPVPKLTSQTSQQEATEIERTAYDAAPLLLDGKPVTILTVNDKMCRFPVNGNGINTQFCGHSPAPGRAYCPHHVMRVINPEASEKFRKAWGLK